MSKFTERMFLFVLTPLTTIWSSINIMTCQDCVKGPQTVGAALGLIVAATVTIVIPLSIGLFIRRKRIQKEKRVLI